MKGTKKGSEISNARIKSYVEMGDIWDEQSLADIWDGTHPVEFEVNLRHRTPYFRIEERLAKKLRATAKKRGVSSESLLNAWVREKLS